MRTAPRRRFAVRLAAALQATLLMSLGIVVSTGGPANAWLSPGTVITSTTATLPPELAPLANGKRIQYFTTSVTGATTVATGLVLTPKTGKTNRTVVWSHGTTGIADKCTPSTNQAVFWPEARAAIAALLRKGWTVTAPDYPGLGTPEAHPYLVGNSEGRAIIDSVKAARSLDPALSTQYAVDGHSQGGQGALFAGQLAPSYDGSLVLKGVAAIAPVSNLDMIAPEIPGSPGQGYLVMALYGINAVEPTFNPNSYLASPAKQRTSVLQTGCLNEILEAYAPLNADELVPNGVVSPTVLSKLAQYGNPATVPPSAPILIVQGTDDDAVPYAITAGPLLDELDQYDQEVTFVPITGASHDGAVFASVDTVTAWIATHFS
ncbi:alpha/beta fold hydrolase [Pseudosporangium ferrugineum]|uniref:Secretory lipase n=1 Tax=Pseudosporangium ferrugineum TaxID=439699 RepID=A0A2T0RXI4_9ACTN|nr:alpha/beta fold hydrolase [Pseudosporangium ferrugineum]PRY25753.1 secretory lipase [Pseudosporangium ferrugineum]